MGLAFSPDGATLAISAASHPIELWDVKTGRAIYRQSPGIEHVFATKDPEMFGSVDDSHVHLWSLKTGEIEESFPATYQPKGSTYSYSGPIQDSQQLVFAGSNVVLPRSGPSAILRITRPNAEELLETGGRLRTGAFRYIKLVPARFSSPESTCNKTIRWNPIWR